MNILTLDTEVYSHMYIRNKMEDLVKAGLINSHHLTLRFLFVPLHFMVHKTQTTVQPQSPHIVILLYDYIIMERYPAHARIEYYYLGLYEAIHIYPHYIIFC